MGRTEASVFLQSRGFLSTVFIASILGSLAAVLAVYSGKISALAGDKATWYTAAMLIPSASALILSSSVLGLVLLPVCVFLSGFMVSWFAGNAGAGKELTQLIIPQLLATPVLFIIATLGMYNSAELCRVFARSTTKQKGIWGRRFVLALIAASTLVFVAYLFI